MKYINDFFEVDTDEFSKYSDFTFEVWENILINTYSGMEEYNKRIHSFIYDTVFYNSDFSETVLKYISDNKDNNLDIYRIICEKIKNTENINNIVIEFITNTLEEEVVFEELNGICNFFNNIGIMKYVTGIKISDTIYIGYYKINDRIFSETFFSNGYKNNSNNIIINEFTYCASIISKNI